MKGLNRMQKKKYKKPILEVEYYTLETTISACGETSYDGGGDNNDQTSEDDMFASISAYAINGTSCSCYYSSGNSATTATSVS